jgi:predicted RND superfamily exporter protein
MRFKINELVSFLSSGITMIVLMMLSFALTAVIFRIRKLKKNMTNESLEEFNEKYPELNSGLRKTLNESIVIYWKALLLIR